MMADNPSRYMLLRAADSDEEFERACSAIIENGWIPLGAPSIEGWDSHNASGTDYRQAFWMPLPAKESMDG